MSPVAVGAAARRGIDPDLAADRVPLPPGEVSEHGREALVRFAAILPELALLPQELRRGRVRQLVERDLQVVDDGLGAIGVRVDQAQRGSAVGRHDLFQVRHQRDDVAAPGIHVAEDVLGVLAGLRRVGAEPGGFVPEDPERVVNVHLVRHAHVHDLPAPTTAGGPFTFSFKVQDADGGRFWLFRDGQARWYLHGLFA